MKLAIKKFHKKVVDLDILPSIYTVNLTLRIWRGRKKAKNSWQCSFVFWNSVIKSDQERWTLGCLLWYISYCIKVLNGFEFVTNTPLPSHEFATF